MEDRLKSCPFCGGEAKVKEVGYKYRESFYVVECQCCCVGVDADTKEAAIEQWNRRKPMDRIVEQLEEQSITWKPSSKEWWKPSSTTISLKKAIEIVKNGGKDE